MELCFFQGQEFDATECCPWLIASLLNSDQFKTWAWERRRSGERNWFALRREFVTLADTTPLPAAHAASRVLTVGDTARQTHLVMRNVGFRWREIFNVVGGHSVFEYLIDRNEGAISKKCPRRAGS